MALISCPECGKEISNKAHSCPNCGCTANEFLECEKEVDDEGKLNRIFEESAVDFHMDRGKNSYIEIRENMMRVCGISNVTDYLEKFILLYDKDTMGVPCVRFTHDSFQNPIRLEPMYGSKNIEKIRELAKILREKSTVKEMGVIASANYRTDAQKYRNAEQRENISKQINSDLEKISDTFGTLSGKGKVARCPKCKSTSISYDAKKLSVGRGVAGGLIGSTVNPIGTAVGVTLGGLSSKKGYCVCLNCGKRWKI